MKLMIPQLNWIEQLTSNQQVEGSSPSGIAKLKENEMEPVTGLFLGFMLFMNIAQENKIAELETNVHYLAVDNAILLAGIEELNNDYMKLGSMHAADVAGLKTVDQQMQKRDETLKSAIDYTLTTLETHSHEE